MKTPCLKHALAAATCAAALVGVPAQAANVFQTDLASITASGTAGTLRAGSIWSGFEFPASALSTVVDGSFVPQFTQWTNGTYWWDELLVDRQGPANPVVIEITLNAAHTVNRFVVQGDDNEDYVVDYWDGAAWVQAFNAAAVGGPGMETRDSGLIAAVTSDRFRLRGAGGDSYYSVAEIQAFDVARVSEPGVLALALLGLGLALRRRAHAGQDMRRHRRVA